MRDELLTEHGLVHGGVFAGAAEAIASTGTALAVMGEGNAAMGLSNDTTVLADVRDGHDPLPRPRRAPRRARVGLDRGRRPATTSAPVAHSRVTVAVRPLRRPS